MRPDDPFDLDREVADAYRDYPELEGNTYFYDLGKNRLVHPRLTPEMPDKITREPEFKKLAREFRKNKASYSVIGRVHLPFNVVFLYLEKDSANLGVGPRSYADGQAKRAVFDHELGHALTLHDPRDALRYEKQWLLKETMAETFALLRQYQRYGVRNKAIRGESRVDMGAFYFVFGGYSDNSRLVNDNYFFSPALETIVELKKQFNVAALSPRETVDLARVRALRHTPDKKTLDNLRAELAVDSRDFVLTALSARLLETTSPQALKWGSRALNYAMGPDYERHPDAEEFRKKYWPKVKKALAKKERALNRP